MYQVLASWASCFVYRAGAGNYTNSTLFVDVVGALDNINATDFNTTTAAAAVKTQAAQVEETVKAGYMVRASADWDVSCHALPRA